MFSFHQKPSPASQVTPSFDTVLEQKKEFQRNVLLIQKLEERKEIPAKSFSSVVKKNEDDILMEGIILPDFGEKHFMSIASNELPNVEERASGTPVSFGETTDESDSEDDSLDFFGSNDALLDRSISNDSTKKDNLLFKPRYLEPTDAAAPGLSVVDLKERYKQEAVGVSGRIGYWRHKHALFGGTYDQAIRKLEARSEKNADGASCKTLKAFGLRS